MEWYPSDSSRSCLRVNSNNFEYEEFSCLYPTLGASYLSFERNYDPVPIRDYMIQHSWIPIFACVAYLVLIAVGRSYFSKREPSNQRTLLAVWNLGLAAFSFIGFVRVLPALMHNIVNYSWRENFCLDPESHFGSGSTGLWVQLFILSKFPELIDTYFIVVHKKPLIFLHWYHHISVLLYCWHSYVTKAPVGIMFCVMNYGVHALMYFYYFLMAVRCKPKWLNAYYITIAQISQMIVGVAVTITGWYLMLYDEKVEGCKLSRENNMAALVMYGSYLALFVQFFVHRYLTRSSSKSAAAASASKAAKATNGKRRKED